MTNTKTEWVVQLKLGKHWYDTSWFGLTRKLARRGLKYCRKHYPKDSHRIIHRTTTTTTTEKVIE